MNTLTGDNSDVADEDLQIIISVCQNLILKKAKFRVNLPNGCVLTNVSEKIMQFPGIDLIAENHQKIMEIDATTPHILVMPSNKFKSRVKIGKLFGMSVYADPSVPKDKFLIEQSKEEDST